MRTLSARVAPPQRSAAIRLAHLRPGLLLEQLVVRVQHDRDPADRRVRKQARDRMPEQGTAGNGKVLLGRGGPEPRSASRSRHQGEVTSHGSLPPQSATSDRTARRQCAQPAPAEDRSRNGHLPALILLILGIL